MAYNGWMIFSGVVTCGLPKFEHIFVTVGWILRKLLSNDSEQRVITHIISVFLLDNYYILHGK